MSTTWITWERAAKVAVHASRLHFCANSCQELLHGSMSTWLAWWETAAISRTLAAKEWPDVRRAHYTNSLFANHNNKHGDIEWSWVVAIRTNPFFIFPQFSHHHLNFFVKFLFYYYSKSMEIQFQYKCTKWNEQSFHAHEGFKHTKWKECRIEGNTS